MITVNGKLNDRNSVLEFMRKHREEWLSSDEIFDALSLYVPKRILISWLKRWELMGILRRSTVSELRHMGVTLKDDVHFSSYLWKWHEGAEGIGE